MNAMKNCFLLVWKIIDPIYYFFTRLTYVENGKKESTIFRVRLTTYKGCALHMKDGTFIRPNDKLIKIHLHNVKLLKELVKFKCEVKRGRYVFQKVIESLPDLADYMESHPKRKEIKGIIGITTLHRGCNRLGFEIYEIRSKPYLIIKQVTLLFIYLISTSTVSKATYKKQEPKYLLMSADTLVNRYLSKVNLR